MNVDHHAIGRRLREARLARGVSQDEAARAIGVSQPTYVRIEQGTRVLRGDELVRLADRMGIRVAALTRLPEVESRARCAARTDGTRSSMATMKHRLYQYLELDAYLTDQGIPRA